MLHVKAVLFRQGTHLLPVLQNDPLHCFVKFSSGNSHCTHDIVLGLSHPALEFAHARTHRKYVSNTRYMMVRGLSL
jgi:hypothetical protein